MKATGNSSLCDTSPAAWRGTESIFWSRGYGCSFPKAPEWAARLPGDSVLHCPSHRTVSFFHVSQGCSTWKHTPCPACSNALTTNLKAASPQDAETSSLGPSVPPHRRQSSSLSPGDVYSAQVYTTQSANDIWAHVIFEWFWNPSFFPILKFKKYSACTLL